MRTDESLVVTSVELIQDPEDESAGLVSVVAHGPDGDIQEVRVTFYGAVQDHWTVGQSVFVTLTTESEGDWIAAGSPVYAPRGIFDEEVD